MASENWETDSGLLSDYEGTVVDAYWSKNNAGVLYLGMKLATDNPDRPETEERYSTGRQGGWDSFDGGATAESKKSSKFNENSGMGKLINKVIPLIGADQVDAVLGDSPRVASVWIGTKWFFEDEVNSFKDQNNPEGPDIVFHQNFPTKFLGKDEEITSSEPSTNGASQSPSPSVTNGGSVNLSILGDDADKPRMYALALSHSQFSDKMLELLMEKGLLGTSDGDMLIKAVADEAGLYSELKSS